MKSSVGSAAWGATAKPSERRSGIATRAGALAEIDRQLAFWDRGPFAVEVHRLGGTDWTTSIGLVVTIVGNQLGYDAGIDVFVLEAEADRSTGLSQVTVLRPMKGA